MKKMILTGKRRTGSTAAAALGLAFAAAALAGCLNLEREYPEKSYYLVAAERKTAKRAAVPRAVLRVSPCRVAPAFDKTRLVIRRGENAYDSDFYHEYFLPPSDMVTMAVREWFTQSGLFANVVPGGSSVDANLLLETAVPALYADLRDSSKPAAVVAFQALFLHDAPDGPKVLLERSYRETVPAADVSAAAIVAGLNEALAKALAALEADMAKVDLKVATAGPGTR